MWYSLFKYALARPIVQLYLRVKLIGGGNIPATGGAILAANHVSAGDTFALPALIQRQLIFPAKKELFLGRTIKGRFVAWALKAVGQVPMDRSGGRASALALGPILGVLHDGGLAGIFPEGTRSPDGRLYRGHTGVARLALVAGVPVVPVGVLNTVILRNRFGIPYMKKARIIIGEPLDFSAWAGQQDSAVVLRWVTNEVMGAIQALTGQDYVDVYGTHGKRRDLVDDGLSDKAKRHPNEGDSVPPGTAELAAGR